MFNNPHVKKEIKMHDLHIQIKGRIPDTPISIYWLLTHMSQAVHLTFLINTNTFLID